MLKTLVYLNIFMETVIRYFQNSLNLLFFIIIIFWGGNIIHVFTVSIEQFKVSLLN